MKRTTVILAFLLALGAVASAQYAYSSTSLSQTSGTIYASNYVEVDYLTADYYWLATWNEFDQNCTYYSCDYPTNTVAAGWSYGTSSTSWSSSTPVSYAEYALYAAPEVVTYYYYDNEYDEPVYEDEYGYSYGGGEDCTPDFYEYAPGSYVELAYDIIPLDLAYSAAVTCDFTIAPVSAHTSYCTTMTLENQLFQANVTPSLSQCLPASGSCSASVGSGSLEMYVTTPYTCNITDYVTTGTAYFYGPDTASSNNSLNVGFSLTLLGQAVSTRCLCRLSVRRGFMYTLNRKTPVLERLSRLYGMAAFLIAFAHAQTPPQGYMLHGYATLPIRATADGSMEGTWRIISANLSENLATTWGILAIQNISGSPISQARFYAEYYDSAGNMCMTMVFAGEANTRRAVDAIAAGASRELLTLSAGLGPATTPVEVRVRLISQSIEGRGAQTGAGDSIIRAPVTAGSATTDPWQRLKMDTSGSADDPAVMDLILARVFVEASGGKAERIEVLNSASSEIRTWFDGFAKQLYFSPASAGFQDTVGTGLIFVRAIKSSIIATEPGPLLSRQSPWIRSYASGFSGSAIPPIIQILFERSSLLHAIGPDAAQRQAVLNASPDVFELGFAGAEWSGSVTTRRMLPNPTEQPLRLHWQTPQEMLQ